MKAIIGRLVEYLEELFTLERLAACSGFYGFLLAGFWIIEIPMQNMWWHYLVCCT